MRVQDMTLQERLDCCNSDNEIASAVISYNARQGLISKYTNNVIEHYVRKNMLNTTMKNTWYNHALSKRFYNNIHKVKNSTERPYQFYIIETLQGFSLKFDKQIKFKFSGHYE